MPVAYEKGHLGADIWGHLIVVFGFPRAQATWGNYEICKKHLHGPKATTLRSPPSLLRE